MSVYRKCGCCNLRSETLDYLCPLCVAVLWGATTPLLKKYSFKRTTCSPYLYLLFDNWKYILSLLTNQLGSLLFVYSLKGNDLSIISPVVNALTFMVTFVFGRIIGEEKDSWNSYIGVIFILIGTTLCIVDKSQ